MQAGLVRGVFLAAVVPLLALVLSGCSAIVAQNGIEATDLAEIKAGASRETVERLLGPPIGTITSKFGTADIYEYDRGRRPGRPEDFGMLHRDEPVADGAMGYVLFYLLTQPYWMTELYEEQKGEITVYFDDDDIVVASIASGIDEEIAGDVVIKNASCGNPVSLYDIGRGYEIGISAIHHRPIATQPVEAYFWYTLAAKRGLWAARGRVERLEATLSEGDVAWAERRAAEWEPLPDCDRLEGISVLNSR